MPRPAYSRRDFLRQTAATASAAASASVGVAAQAFGSSPHGRLRIGVIGAGVRGQQHLDALARLQAAGWNLEIGGLCDVYLRHREQASERLARHGLECPLVVSDFRELLAGRDLDAVVIATPDHWHAQMTRCALAAGKHVYCERPLVHRLEEVAGVLEAARSSGQVVQVGCQRTSDLRWQAARDYLAAGKLGQVVQAHVGAYRNSALGQWRNLGLARDMTPRTVDWPLFLGLEYGLSPEVPFDRALFAQWRCHWAFSRGMYSELLLPRLTEMLTALDVRYPERVVSTGGIFAEQDGRDVPDTVTLAADFATADSAGLQVLATGTTANDYAHETIIRGRLGTLRFDLSRDGFDFVPERPQATRVRDARSEHIAAAKPADETLAHWENFLLAIAAGDPGRCHNPPEVAAAAAVTLLLGVEGYRRGRVLGWDPATHALREPGASASAAWEARSRAQPASQRLAGPWQGMTDPAG